MIQVVILAAGMGKRMQSALPKVLHLLGGKTLLQHVIQTAKIISHKEAPIVVEGHEGDQLKQCLSNELVTWVHQDQTLGTGHAVLQALPMIMQGARVLILCGDVPLIGVDTLQQLITTTPVDAIGMVTAHLVNPFGYGRIIRNREQEIIGIVEQKDANEQQQSITEINTGIYLIPEQYLAQCLPRLSKNNAQGEYYLTDVMSFAVNEGLSIHAVQPGLIEEIMGVNDRFQLANLERFYQQKQAKKWMLQGVTILDPARFDIRGDVEIGKDVIIDINVILEGKVMIGSNCKIGANCILKNVQIADGVEIKAFSVLEDTVIGQHAKIGPFARIRPGTVLAAETHIGNFVEIKNAKIGEGSKINHLSYIGDSMIGQKVNVGAGTITCNYDGVAKHQTEIKDGAFIGSNTALVAPVTVGEGATIGAGSTITANAPAHQLTLARVRQMSLPAWKRPVKE